MTKSKNPKSNPIENAIGNRAKSKNPSMNNISPEQIPTEPSPSEMLSLEELNRQTEERLLDDPKRLLVSQEKMTDKEHFQQQTNLLEAAKKTTPVSKPDPQPVTTTSSPESQPPQKNSPNALTEKPASYTTPPTKEDRDSFNRVLNIPAEDKELMLLKEYILDNGFVVSTVAFHIVALCSQPMVTPSTTGWDFADREHIPELVFALLHQPGYIEGIWPSLRIVMGSSRGNPAWTAGIAMTIAFFDVIRTLPTLKAMKK